jgi:hypothetical protein
MKAQAKVPRGCEERSDPSGGRARSGAVARANVCRAVMASHEKWVVGFGQPSFSRIGEGQWIPMKATGQCSWDLPRLMDDGTRGMIGDPKQRRSRCFVADGASREARLSVASRLADRVVVAMTLEDTTTSAEQRTRGAAECRQVRGSSRHAFGPTGSNDRVADVCTKGVTNSADGPPGQVASEENVRCRRLEAVLGKTRRTEFQKGRRETGLRQDPPGHEVGNDGHRQGLAYESPRHTSTHQIRTHGLTGGGGTRTA